MTDKIPLPDPLTPDEIQREIGKRAAQLSFLHKVLNSPDGYKGLDEWELCGLARIIENIEIDLHQVEDMMDDLKTPAKETRTERGWYCVTIWDLL